MRRARTVPLSRILVIVGGLALTGAAIGAVLAPLLLVVLGVASRGAAATGFGWSLPRAAGIGAGLGAILLPTTAWWLMRSVPLGRALVGTTLGTLVGGAIGVFLTSLYPYAAIVAALTGYLGSVILLRRGAHRRRQLAAAAGRDAREGEP